MKLVQHRCLAGIPSKFLCRSVCGGPSGALSGPDRGSQQWLPAWTCHSPWQSSTGGSSQQDSSRSLPRGTHECKHSHLSAEAPSRSFPATAIKVPADSRIPSKTFSKTTSRAHQLLPVSLHWRLLRGPQDAQTKNIGDWGLRPKGYQTGSSKVVVVLSWSHCVRVVMLL